MKSDIIYIRNVTVKSGKSVRCCCANLPFFIDYGEEYMKIQKILNNNAVIAIDRTGQEVLVFGNGLGFKNKEGTKIDTKKIVKQFVLKDKAQRSRFEEIFSTIPVKYITLAETVISYAAKIHSMELSDMIHVSLVDHIYNAICNYEDGVFIPNSIIDDIIQFYPQEYDVGKHALELIKQETGYKLPDDEAGFVAMHFVTAQQTEENINASKIVRFVREINDFIFKWLNLDVDDTSLTYYRYMRHIKCFAQRVMQNFHYPNEGQDKVLNLLVEQYPDEYECSKEVCEYIRSKYDYTPGADEEIYLAVHLARLKHQ